MYKMRMNVFTFIHVHIFLQDTSAYWGVAEHSFSLSRSQSSPSSVLSGGASRTAVSRFCCLARTCSLTPRTCSLSPRLLMWILRDQLRQLLYAVEVLNTPFLFPVREALVPRYYRVELPAQLSLDYVVQNLFSEFQLFLEVSVCLLEVLWNSETPFIFRGTQQFFLSAAT